MAQRHEEIRDLLEDLVQLAGEDAVRMGAGGAGGRSRDPDHNIRALFDRIMEGLTAPVDVVIHCPKCGLQHVDHPEPGVEHENGTAEFPAWDNPPHRSHLCHGCGHVWRVADVPTNGVAAVKTTGKADSPITSNSPGGDDRARLLQHAADLLYAAESDNSDYANCSWRSLPVHLQAEIEARTDVLHKEMGSKSPARLASREPGFIKPDTDKQVFFYENDFYVLSNFSAFSVKWYLPSYTGSIGGNVRFDTSEHLYHYLKFATGDGDSSVGPSIFRAASAHDAFKLAEVHRSQRRTDWDDVKVGLMREILRAKADQHEYVRRKLLDTGDRELIEDSWRDSFWGWGTNRDGHNMLGKLWMELRTEFRSRP